MSQQGYSITTRVGTIDNQQLTTQTLASTDNETFVDGTTFALRASMVEQLVTTWTFSLALQTSSSVSVCRTQRLGPN